MPDRGTIQDPPDGLASCVVDCPAGEEGHVYGMGLERIAGATLAVELDSSFLLFANTR